MRLVASRPPLPHQLLSHLRDQGAQPAVRGVVAVAYVPAHVQRKGTQVHGRWRKGAFKALEAPLPLIG